MHFLILKSTYKFFRFQPPPLKFDLILNGGSSIDLNFSGTYLQGTGLTNGNPFWLQQNGSYAIWYYKVTYGNVLAIGNVTDLGKFQGNIYVNADKSALYPNTTPPITFKEIGMHIFHKLIGKVQNLLDSTFRGTFCSCGGWMEWEP